MMAVHYGTPLSDLERSEGESQFARVRGQPYGPANLYSQQEFRFCGGAFRKPEHEFELARLDGGRRKCLPVNSDRHSQRSVPQLLGSAVSMKIQATATPRRAADP